jgi:hypothetical protein
MQINNTKTHLIVLSDILQQTYSDFVHPLGAIVGSLSFADTDNLSICRQLSKTVKESKYSFIVCNYVYIKNSLAVWMWGGVRV